MPNHDPHIIPRNLRRVAKFLRAVEVITAHEQARAGLSQSAEWLDNAARHIEREEHHMARMADELLKARKLIADRDTTITHQAQQITQLQANQTAPEDIAAMDAFDADFPNAPADTTTGGTGADTTGGGAQP